MEYRKDIDGLRALAVIPVVLFHLGIPAFSGGYVGVDVFFVISGYLITGIIVRDIEKGNFSLVNFYERRIRRIFPALFMVLVITTMVSYKVYSPSELMRYSKSLASISLFSSNFLFLRESGYFSPSAEIRPLLHTWSLSIEEQFYIFFPILLTFSFKYLRKPVVPIIIAAILSFTANIILVSEYKEMVFFMLPTRAWELCLGGILALNLIPKLSNNNINNWLSLIGLMMLIFSVFKYDSITVYPGLAASIPCLGAALMIYTGDKHTIIARLLSFRGFVFVGLISYSLYLWHWPTIVLFKNFKVLPITLENQLAILLFSVLLSFFSC